MSMTRHDDNTEMTPSEMGRTLLRIEEQVKTTNGRVTAIELWKAKITGAWFVVSLTGPVVTVLAVKLIG